MSDAPAFANNRPLVPDDSPAASSQPRRESNPSPQLPLTPSTKRSIADSMKSPIALPACKSPLALTNSRPHCSALTMDMRCRRAVAERSLDPQTPPSSSVALFAMSMMFCPRQTRPFQMRICSRHAQHRGRAAKFSFHTNQGHHKQDTQCKVCVAYPRRSS